MKKIGKRDLGLAIMYLSWKGANLVSMRDHRLAHFMLDSGLSDMEEDGCDEAHKSLAAAFKKEKGLTVSHSNWSIDTSPDVADHYLESEDARVAVYALMHQMHGTRLSESNLLELTFYKDSLCAVRNSSAALRGEKSEFSLDVRRIVVPSHLGPHPLDKLIAEKAEAIRERLRVGV